MTPARRLRHTLLSTLFVPACAPETPHPSDTSATLPDVAAGGTGSLGLPRSTTADVPGPPYTACRVDPTAPWLDGTYVPYRNGVHVLCLDDVPPEVCAAAAAALPASGDAPRFLQGALYDALPPVCPFPYEVPDQGPCRTAGFAARDACGPLVDVGETGACCFAADLYTTWTDGRPFLGARRARAIRRRGWT